MEKENVNLPGKHNEGITEEVIFKFNKKTMSTNFLCNVDRASLAEKEFQGKIVEWY
jgi:hypothetical protein